MKDVFDPPFTYIFVRQDISWEQQLVQSSHVALELGAKMSHSYEGLYFAVIGVRDIEELEFVEDHLDHHKISFERFVEPDIGMEVTAVATHPIYSKDRKHLKDYKLLTFRL